METLYFILKYVLVIPHLICFYFADKNDKIRVIEDVNYMNQRCRTQRSLAYFLLCRKPYRNLFYHRIPCSRIFKALLPQYDLFTINSNCDIEGGAFVLNHPYATILNAKKIGKNFTCCHLTTIGNARNGRNDLVPSIGSNVTLGANVTIIGDIKIGDNVIIGAGSVVVKDVPDNSVVVGNPGRLLKK